MMINTSLRRVFKQIGLSDKHTSVYQVLLTKPSTTPLRLARETKLNRSSLYRYLEELRSKGFVELVLGDKSSRYEAKPDGLSQYLLGEEARVENLKNIIPRLAEELKKTGQHPVESEVKYFHGVEGLKQMLWNVVNTKTEFVGLGYENWNTSVGKAYAEKLRARWVERGIKTREIQNLPNQDFNYTNQGEEYQSGYEHRWIDSKVLEIKHDTYVYDDIFAYHYHYQGEYFGVEIHNREIARTERQMFEILWRMAS